MESCGLVGRALVMVERLKLGWWHVGNGAVQTPVVHRSTHLAVASRTRSSEPELAPAILKHARVEC